MAKKNGAKIVWKGFKQFEQFLMPLNKMKPDKKNVRAHSERNIMIIKTSMNDMGQHRLGVLMDDGTIQIGNGMWKAAKELGWTHLAAVKSGDKGAIAKIRALTDNRSGDPDIGSDWSFAELADLLEELDTGEFDMASIGWNEDEIEDIMTWQGDDPPTKEGPLPAPPKKAHTKVGDIWLLGPHRVLCGRCNNANDVKRLAASKDVIMATDPPYCSGGSQDAQKKEGTWGEIDSDNLSTRGYQSLMSAVIQLHPCRAYYVFTDWRMWIPLFDLMEGAGQCVRSMLVWAKENPAMGGIWRTQHELVMFASQENQAKRDGQASIGNILRAKRTGNKEHYTQKPLDLMMDILTNDSTAKRRKNSHVLDPFMGSGTTLIAAERLGRTCYGMEIEPRYVDVICQRYFNSTGKIPTHADTGAEFPVDKTKKE